MRQALLICTAVWLVTAVLHGQEPPAIDWRPMAWLIGNWTSTGGGQPGHGSGSFSFHPDLQGKVLIRRNLAQYPASNGKPAYRHEDLMVIFPDGANFRGDYFDSEGHIIHYAVSISENGSTVTFLGEQTSQAPRFRLRYHKTGEGLLAGTFEMAPRGKPEAFSKYLEWTAKKSGQ